MNQLKKEAKMEDFQKMIDIFEEDLGAPLTFKNIDMHRLFLNGQKENGETNELMLRINPLMNKVVIARINFVHERAGYGTRLLEVIKEYAKDNNFEIIQVESVLSESMQSFLIKHGFELATPYDYEMNWNLTV